MGSSLVSRALECLVKSGINYVCSDCGALLYHTGADGAFESGEIAFPSKQPIEVAYQLGSCPNCGRTLNAEPDLDSIKVGTSTTAKPAS